MGTVDKVFFIYTLPLYFTLGFFYTFNFLQKFSIKELFSIEKKVWIRFFLVSFFCAITLLAFLFFSEIEAYGKTYKYISYLLEESELKKENFYLWYDQLFDILSYICIPIFSSDRIYIYSNKTIIFSCTIFLLFLFPYIEKSIKNNKAFSNLIICFLVELSIFIVLCGTKLGYLLSSGYIYNDRAIILSSLVFLLLLFAYIKKDVLISGLTISFFIEVGVFLILYGSKLAHHYVYFHIPIIIWFMLYVNNDNKIFGKIVIGLSIVSLISTILLIGSKTVTHSEIERNKIYTYLNQKQISRDALINFSTWGFFHEYYLMHDKDQIVTKTFRMIYFNDSKLNKSMKEYFKTRRNQQDIIGLAKKMNKKYILNVSYNTNFRELNLLYPDSKITKIPIDGTRWEVHKVEFD